MKVIGVVGYRIGDAAFGVANTYLEFAQKFGKPRILVPEDDVEQVDAVILPGGADVNPASYGQAPAFATSSTDVFKQYFFDEKLPAYIAHGIPVFGICLGFQQLNVYFGGKLCQHLRWHDNSPGRWNKGHEVTFENVYDALRFNVGKKQDVNSHHHQAVIRKDLAHCLTPLANTENKDEKGVENQIIEAFVHKTLPVAGVQWHPEEWYDEFAISLFNHILQ